MSRSHGSPWRSLPDVPSYFCSARSWPTIRRAAFWHAAAVRQVEEISEGGLQAGIEGARPRRTDGTRVRELGAAIGEIGHRRGIEGRSVGRVAVIENIVRAGVDLEGLVDLIRGMQVEHRVGRQPRRLIGLVADKI